MSVFEESELELHRRIVRELEDNVHNRDWWIWIHFDRERDGDYTLAGMADEIETWLGSLDPNVQVESAYPLEWPEGGLTIEFRAIPRGRDRRGGPPLVGNPFPAVAFWT